MFTNKFESVIQVILAVIVLIAACIVNNAATAENTVQPSLPQAAEPWFRVEEDAKYGNPAAQASVGSDYRVYTSVVCDHYGQLEFSFGPPDSYTGGAATVSFDFHSGSPDFNTTTISIPMSYDTGWGEFETITSAHAHALFRLFKKYREVQWFFPLDARLQKLSLMGFTRTSRNLGC